MNWKLLLCHLIAVAILVTVADANLENVEKVEESTESPIADMAMIDADLKTSTEKPPTFDATTNEKSDKMTLPEKPEKANDKPQSQRHTVADFIIHPLIAFKPRTPEDESPAGKQASTSSTTASPWQLFGFNAGQGLGSSVSSLTSGISGWLTDRIQLPGLVDTPVRESTTTSTTTTTTQRPDVVVRVQQRPQSSRRPVIRINNRNRPNRVDFDSFEEEDEEEEENDDVQQQSQEEEEDNNENDEDEQDDGENDAGSDNRLKDGDQNEEQEDDNAEDENENESGQEDDEEEQVVQRPNNRRRPVQQKQQNKRRNGQLQNQMQQNRRKSVSAQRPQRRRQQLQQQRLKQQQNFVNDEDEEFFFGERPSMKRSQSQTGFIQRGQQNLLNQIRQLTRGQTPAEIGNAMRKPQSSSNKRRQQATLFINRNGQTVYMAPELMNSGAAQFEYSPHVVVKTRVKPITSNAFPQPPLTAPLKRKGRPTQYITIPWSQLGISPPDQIISLTDGIQSKPIILNIPQSAINQMQSPSRKKKRPVITADAVPLLAEASLMDIFKPPKIPPSRTTNATRKPSIVGTPIHIVAKPKPNKHTPALLPQRIRPGTIVEVAPAIEAAEKPTVTAENTASSVSDEIRNSEKDFIIVGNDEEPGLTRQVQPVFGDARYVQVGGIKPYFEVFNRGGGHFALRKTGRSLEQQEPLGIVNSHGGVEHQIPVQVITEESPKKAAEQSLASPEKVAEKSDGLDIPEMKKDEKEMPKLQETATLAATEVKA